MTEIHSIESVNLGELNLNPAFRGVAIPSRLYRIVKVPVNRESNWYPKGSRSICPLLAKGLTLAQAVDIVSTNNRRVVKDGRHKWHAVVLADSQVSESSWGVAVLHIEPADYPESPTGLPWCRIIGGENGQLPEPQTKKQIFSQMCVRNHQTQNTAWLPRCWHLLSPVV